MAGDYRQDRERLWAREGWKRKRLRHIEKERKIETGERRRERKRGRKRDRNRKREREKEWKRDKYREKWT